MSERFQISGNGDGTYLVIDTMTEEPVLLNSRADVYSAPEANAQWTADHLNLAEDRKAGLLSVATPESAVKPEPEGLADWERELLELPEPEEFSPDPAALLHVANPEPGIALVSRRVEPRHAAPNAPNPSAYQLAYEVGAYRTGAHQGEKYVRRALELVTDDMPYALHSALWSALAYLESARETAENLPEWLSR